VTRNNYNKDRRIDECFSRDHGCRPGNDRWIVVSLISASRFVVGCRQFLGRRLIWRRRGGSH
jgi:hypothetical protein